MNLQPEQNKYLKLNQIPLSDGQFKTFTRSLKKTNKNIEPTETIYFDIKELQTIPESRLEEALFQSDDFVIPPPQNGRELVRLKAGKLYIEFQPGGKMSFDLKIKLIDKKKKTLRSFLDLNQPRYSVVQFENLLPILLDAYYDSATGSASNTTKIENKIALSHAYELKTIITKLMLDEELSQKDKDKFRENYLALYKRKEQPINSEKTNNNNLSKKNIKPKLKRDIEFFGKNPTTAPNSIFEIAAKIGTTFFLNLSISVEEITRILQEYLQYTGKDHSFFNDPEIQKNILETLIDKERFPLKGSVDDIQELLKEAVENLCKLDLEKKSQTLHTNEQVTKNSLNNPHPKKSHNHDHDRKSQKYSDNQDISKLLESLLKRNAIGGFLNPEDWDRIPEGELKKRIDYIVDLLLFPNQHDLSELKDVDLLAKIFAWNNASNHILREIGFDLQQLGEVAKNYSKIDLYHSLLQAINELKLNNKEAILQELEQTFKPSITETSNKNTSVPNNHNQQSKNPEQFIQNSVNRRDYESIQPDSPYSKAEQETEILTYHERTYSEGARTRAAREILDIKKSPIVKDNQNKSYLFLSRVYNYAALPPEVTNFAFLGTSSQQEAVIIEKNDEYLNAIKREFIEEVGEVVPSQLFAAALKFSEKKLGHHSPQRVYQFINSRFDQPEQTIQGIPAIPLSDFIKEGVGVCRHHSLLLGNILSAYVEHYQVPDVEVHVIRESLEYKDREKSGAHVCCVWKNIKTGRTYVLDGYWRKMWDITYPEGYNALSAHYEDEGYGPKFVEAIMHIVNPSLNNIAIIQTPNIEKEDQSTNNNHLPSNLKPSVPENQKEIFQKPEKQFELLMTEIYNENTSVVKNHEISVEGESSPTSEKSKDSDSNDPSSDDSSFLEYDDLKNPNPDINSNNSIRKSTEDQKKNQKTDKSSNLWEKLLLPKIITGVGIGIWVGWVLGGPIGAAMGGLAGYLLSLGINVIMRPIAILFKSKDDSSSKQKEYIGEDPRVTQNLDFNKDKTLSIPEYRFTTSTQNPENIHNHENLNTRDDKNFLKF